MYMNLFHSVMSQCAEILQMQLLFLVVLPCYQVRKVSRSYPILCCVVLFALLVLLPSEMSITFKFHFTWVFIFVCIISHVINELSSCLPACLPACLQGWEIASRGTWCASATGTLSATTSWWFLTHNTGMLLRLCLTVFDCV
jgi:hypothetical protein